jgi:glutathione S-transferase
MPKIHLVLSPGSCALASHILLREAGVTFDMTKISINLTSRFPDTLQHLNPKRRVPILQIDDESITETPAIMTAISQMAPEKKLMGSTDLEVLRTYEWLNWISGTLHTSGYGALLRPERYVDNEKLYPEVRAKAHKSIQECYEYIEGRLEGRKWAVGERFGAVDAYLFVFWRWGNGAKFSMSERYPNYARLMLEVSKRQSVIDSVEEEGIAMMQDSTV